MIQWKTLEVNPGCGDGLVLGEEMGGTELPPLLIAVLPDEGRAEGCVVWHQ